MELRDYLLSLQRCGGVFLQGVGGVYHNDPHVELVSLDEHVANLRQEGMSDINTEDQWKTVSAETQRLLLLRAQALQGFRVTNIKLVMQKNALMLPIDSKHNVTILYFPDATPELLSVIIDIVNPWVQVEWRKISRKRNPKRKAMMAFDVDAGGCDPRKHPIVAIGTARRKTDSDELEKKRFVFDFDESKFEPDFKKNF